MDSRALRYGFVGAGFNAKFHLAALRQIRGIKVAGVMSVAGAPEFAKLAADWGLGETAVFDSVGEMAKHVDCVAVCAPNYARLEIVEAIADAVKAGAALKGVICEKPLGRNVAEARRLVELARSAGLRTAYFENQIFMKPIRTQLAQLEPVRRQMGPLTLARSAEEHGGPHEAWFWDPTRQGGGVLCDMGCHSIAVGWYVLDADRQAADVPRTAGDHRGSRAAQVGPAGLAREAPQGPGRRLREDPGRGLRDRHDHVPEPGHRAGREGAVHQLVDVSRSKGSGS